VITVLCCTPVLPAAALAQHDLDELHRLMRAFYGCVWDAVQPYGGALQTPMGDRALVVFGAPAAQEDHALRAGLAALALLQRMDEWQRAAGISADAGLAVRIGLHTGRVVVGGLGEAPELLTALVGDVTARATALQEHAAPGTVLCSAATASLIHGQVHCTPIEAVAFPDQTTAEHAYTLHRGNPLHTTRTQPVGRVLSPFVGREHEMASLHALFARAEAGQGQVVGVVGEAGIGKSRLVAEFCDALAGRRLTALCGRCRSYGSTTAYLPVLELLRQACGMTETTLPEASATHVQQYLQVVGLDWETWSPVLLHLLGLQESPAALAGLSPEARKARILTLLTQLWLQVSRQQPLLLVLEDLHWSDPSSDEWLGTLVERMVGAPLLVLATYRPGYRPTWLDKSFATQMALPPLTETASRRVIQAVLPPAIQPSQLVPQLLATAEGNPFFLEELARTVVEQEATAASPTIPETIQGVLLARLDRLPGTAKGLLQTAAVIGKDIALPLLQAITDVPEETLQRDLSYLQTAEFLYETGLVPEPRYTFKHALTQEVTYQSLLRRTRQQYHAHITQALEARFPAVAAAQPELLAHHYTEAGHAAQAIPYWQRAGQKTLTQSAYVEAISHLTRALELLHTLPDTPERTQQELDLQITLGPTLMALKGWAAPEVEHAYARAQALCQQVGQTPQLFHVLGGLWAFYVVRGELQTGQRLAEQCVTLVQSLQDPACLLLAQMMLGMTFFYRGELPSARASLERAFARYDPTQHPHLTTFGADPGELCLAHGAQALFFLGYPEQAWQSVSEAIALAQQLSHPFSLAMVLGVAAWIHWYRREIYLTQKQAEAMITLSTEHGFPHWLAQGTILRGCALVAQGQGEEGIAHIRQGIASHQTTGAILVWPLYLALLAEAYGKVGQAEAGLTVMAEALAMTDKSDERMWEAELYRLKGELLLQQAVSHATQTEVCFHRALAVARCQQAKSWELRTAMSLARLWQCQDKHGAARELLAPIYDWFTEGFDTADLQEAKALFDELE
jgi:predicted ATPase/class 3 adenylate cyclase